MITIITLRIISLKTKRWTKTLTYVKYQPLRVSNQLNSTQLNSDH